MTQPHSVLILGGGIAGISAARALSDSGFMIHLVEKGTHLGGNAWQWACMATDQCQNCGACLAAELVEQAKGLPNTQIYLTSELTQITQTGEQYCATITGEKTLQLQIDAVLMATGFEPFDPTGFQLLGYGQHTKVITTVEFNHALKTDGLADLINDRSAPSIAFIQCVGSRNRQIGRDYCSQVCCKTALRQAGKLIHLLPESQISLFHMDLQIIGKEMRTLNEALAQRINLLQGVPAEILTGHKQDKLTVIREESQTGQRKAHHFDLIVLAVGMGPAQGALDIIKMLDLPKDDWGFAHQKSTDLPKGIYIAGAAHAPTDILSAQKQGLTAADEIIQTFKMGAPSKKIAVIGHGTEGQTVARALAKEKFKVALIDPAKTDSSQLEQIDLFSNSSLKALQGNYGDFQLSLITDGEDKTITVDAVVVANGTTKRKADEDMTLSANTCVMGLGEFEQTAEDIKRIPSNLVFWLDRWQPEWKENCRKTLILAEKMVDQQKSVAIIMDKMLVHGLEGQRLYDQARLKGVKFLRLTPDATPTVTPSDQQVIIKLFEATLPGIELEIRCDALIISEKIEPRKNASTISQQLAIECDQEGFMQPANVRHRPVGSPRKGIFFVGSCHDETDETDLMDEIKAVQATLGQLDRGAYKEPDPPQINEGHCVRCLTCFRICPHGAITLKSFRQPTIMPQACFDCGLCVANCPAEAIGTAKDVLPPKTDQQTKPAHTVVFACQRSGALAAQEAFQTKMCSAEDVELIRVGCASRLNVETLLKPLIAGSQRVLIVSCHSGNCRSEVGPENAAAKVTRIFTETRLPTSMLGFKSIAANEPAAFAAIIAENPGQGKEKSHD